jgi:DNA invertase Pin-like site-specific DNA recombinase
MRTALYLRVSTDDQTVANQRRELEAVAERAKWNIEHILADEGISGSKARDRRPAFDRLHRLIARREIDVVMAWSVDRLGRSLQDLVGVLGELRAADCDLYLHQQGVDTTTPAGRALFQMLGVFAGFERAIIQERVRAGIARARAAGKHLGRPRINGETEREIQAALASGKGIRKVARECGVGVSVVQRIRAG